MHVLNRSKTLRRIELGLLVAGVLLLAVFLTAYAQRTTMSRAALNQFNEVKRERISPAVKRTFADRTYKVDFNLWSTKRVADYRESLGHSFDPPLAVLRIRKVSLEVPVFEGVDDLTLNRAVGYIPGMSLPGEGGNVGIAGHRDGFFRVLKDVAPGDMMELETLDRIDIYRVDNIVIVDKNDSSALLPSEDPKLTLVTCYPFYFVGSAPKRYIVVASLVTSGAPWDLAPQPHIDSARMEPVLENPKPQSHKPTKETIQ
jgi:sortase A